MSDIDKRLEGIFKSIERHDYSVLYADSSTGRENVHLLISTLKAEREEKERYERFLKGISECSDDMGNHIRAKSALGGDRE